MALRHLGASHSFSLSLTRPFTPRALRELRAVLQQASTNTTLEDLGTVKSRNAAVLIPFCNVGGSPGILFEVRGKTLRTHSGEVSFPGGRIDESDMTIVDAALRETYEELGIKPAQIEVIGEIGPPEYSLRGDMKVWPIAGFVHSESPYEKSLSDDDPFPSLDMVSIRREASPSEVDFVFHLPLAALTSPSRLRSYLFRGHRPYWAIDVTDLIHNGSEPGPSAYAATQYQKDEVGPGMNGRLEIWGLTGWYLSTLMKTLNIAQ